MQEKDERKGGEKKGRKQRECVVGRRGFGKVELAV
jgi:hypothetical protein